MDIKKLKNKKMLYPAMALIAGIFMIMLSGVFKENSAPPPAEIKTEYKNLADASQTERKLEKIIGTVAGVSDVSVYVCYENTGIKVPAYTREENIKTSGDEKTSSEKISPVMQKDTSGEIPFVTKEVLTEIRGIIISAKGVDKEIKKLEISHAVSSALGVPMNRVKVLSKN